GRPADARSHCGLHAKSRQDRERGAVRQCRVDPGEPPRLRYARRGGSVQPARIWSVARSGPRRHDAALIEAFKGGGHARSGQLLGAGPKQSILLNVAAPRAFEWSRRAVISSPLLRRAAVAALAALAITWAGMPSTRAQAESRDGFSRTSPSGSYLAARHAGDQRDTAAAASYYRAALRADPRNNELLGRTFLAVLANGEVDEGVKLA